MGRPRKRHRNEDEAHPDSNGNLLESRGDGMSNMIQSPHLEDLLASAPNRYGSEDLDKGELSWNPFQLNPAGMLDFSDFDFARESSQYFDENGLVLLHPQMPTDTHQINFPNLSVPGTPGGRSTMVTQTTSCETSTANGPRCACLANLYLTLSSFQTLPPPSFPLTSGNLKIATTTARDVLRCQICPKTYYSAFQNISLLGTLLPLIIMEHSKLLGHIDERSASGASTTFRMGDQNPAHRHLHTGTNDCPLGFDIEFSATEWRMTVRKAIRQQVHGVKPGDDSLDSLIDELEKRQHAWHNADYPPKLAGHVAVCAQDEDQAERECLRVIRNLRRSIMALNLIDDFSNLS